MAVAVLADAHIDGPGGAAPPLVEQLESLEPGSIDRLIVLGDLFQAWVGFPAFETASVGLLVETFTELGRRGIPVEYVEGNRDFFLQGSRYAAAFRRIALETSFEVEGSRYLAVHGDGLDEGDRQYRIWRAVSKSSVSRFLMKHLPRGLARRLLHGTGRKLSETNFKHKVKIPERAVRSYGERRLAEGYDVLLLGHFHEAGSFRTDGGEIRLLDAWFRTRRIEIFGGRG